MFQPKKGVQYTKAVKNPYQRKIQRFSINKLFVVTYGNKSLYRTLISIHRTLLST